MKIAQNIFDEEYEDIRIGPSEFRDAFRRIIRNNPDLTAKHITVLMFILDRTLAWDKCWEYIFAKQITEGVCNVSMGLNMSARTFYRAINDLEKAKQIIVIHTPRNYRLISLFDYAGYFTDADLKLFNRLKVDPMLVKPYWHKALAEMT